MPLRFASFPPIMRYVFPTLLFMKKLLAQLSGALLASQMFAYRALALPDPGNIGGLAATSNNDIKGLIIYVIEQILDFVLVVAVLYVIIAGIRLIVSGGNDEQKDKAKNTIIYVIAGIIVVLLARVIVTAVNSVFS